MNKTNNIVFIGFAGTGKTTIGQIVASKLNWPFVDIDLEIEQRKGEPISSIFAKEGESYFRDLEQEVLRDVMTTGHQQIVSTGGGSVLRKANREVMLQNGIVFALTANIDTIISRVKDDPDRPLLQGNVHDNVRSLLKARKEAYTFADVTLDTSLHDPEGCAQLIVTAYEAWKERKR